MSVSLSYPFTLQNATTADATQVQANFDAVIAALLNAAASGANNDITSLLALSTPISPAQGGSNVYIGGVSSGSANAQTVTISTPTGFAYTNGMRLTFFAGFTNTGAVTLNVNGLGAKNVWRRTPTSMEACTGGEIVNASLCEVQYDGVQFEILSASNQVGGVGPSTNLASATTTDLGTIASHNVNLTGVATITSFGTPAVNTYPIWRLFFSGAMTLTNSANLILPGAANIVTVSGDTAVAAYLGASIWSVIAYQRGTGRPVKNATTPTVQTFNSGTSQTYTTPAACTQLLVRAVGGGGGGGTAAGGAAAGTGGTTTFNSVNAIGGTGGANQATGAGAAGGAGGTGGTGTATLRVNGTAGALGGAVGGASTDGGVGGNGGGSAFFGAGGGVNGGVPATNTGGGGGGIPGQIPARGGSGGGGGGEYFELIIGSPAPTYIYSVGAAGTSASTAGAAGRITVMEFYD